MRDLGEAALEGGSRGSRSLRPAGNMPPRAGSVNRQLVRPAGARTHAAVQRLTAACGAAYPASPPARVRPRGEVDRGKATGAMARLEQATRRLQAALDQLEHALEARPPAARDGDPALRAALETARRKQAHLQEVTDTVAGRLDAAIARLKATLES